MNVLTVGEFKAQFSKVLKQIRAGEEVLISYGKNRETVAVILPFDKYKTSEKRKLGPLQGKASFFLKKNFKMNDQEFLSS